MSTIQLLSLILLWGFPSLRLVRIYLKSSNEQREDLRMGIKSPWFIFVEGFRILGYLLFISGMITFVSMLKHIGISIITIGWFFGGIEIWDKSITKSISIMSIAVVGAVTYYYLLI